MRKDFDYALLDLALLHQGALASRDGGCEAKGHDGGIGLRPSDGPLEMCEITASDAEAARLAIAYTPARLQRDAPTAADPDYEIAVEVVECAWLDNHKAWLEDD